MPQKYFAHNSLLPFYLAWQVEPDNSAYNLSFSYRFDDYKDIELLINKLQELITLKAFLRQTFSLEEGKLVANIHEHLPAEVNFFTSNMDELPKLNQKLINQPHEISAQSAIKLNIINLTGTNKFLALFNIHHIIMDAYSLENFILDLNFLLSDKKIISETPDEYISELIGEPSLQEDYQSDVFLKYISHVNDVASKVSYPAGAKKDYIWHYIDVMPNEIMHKLNNASTKHNLSVFNLLLLAWAIFTSKFFNQSHALVSYPVNVRVNKQINGCFVNSVVFPWALNPGDTYLSIIDAWKDQVEAFKRLARINLSSELSMGAIPSFAYSNFAHPGDLIKKNKHYVAKSFPQIANANLALKYRKLKGRLVFSCDVLPEICSESLSTTLLSRFFNYVDKLLTNSSVALSELDLTFSKEKQALLYDFNDTEKAYPSDQAIHQLFEEQVSKTSDKVALVYKDVKLTYRELNERANKLASHLRKYYQIKPGNLVALYLDRNEYMVVAILAVLKAGGTYIPMDKNYPNERVVYILKDTNTKLVLTNEVHVENLHSILLDKQVNILSIDNQGLLKTLEKENKGNLKNIVKSTDLAYVIYTSGTTGEPKGVMVEHRGPINTIFAINKAYGVKHNSKKNNNIKISAFTNYTFDVSLSEFFVALFNGCELHILSDEIRRDANLISKYINDYQINCIYLPPVLLANLPKKKYKSLQHIIYAGEPCDKKTGMYWSSKYKLYNLYGPTEASIYAIGLQLKAGEVNLIGKPIANVSCYALDSQLNCVPIGAVGELYLGGDGLARGYLNQEELTRERFIANPFQNNKSAKGDKSSRLYKTGDLVRILSDGNIEYVGRNDYQIKIRGYRIELAEIESTLANYPGIIQAVVIDHRSSNNDSENASLIGYYIASVKLDEEDMLLYLGKYLPYYMLPSRIVRLDKLPLTISGKLDRKSLPIPDLDNNNPYVAPKNELQNQIIEVWSEVLNLPKKSISITDRFFKLGGNSLSIIKIQNKLSKIKAFKSLKLADLFKYTTVEQLTNFINASGEIVKVAKNINKQEIEIAIISLSGVFSGCENIDQYWDLISFGKEGIRKYTELECKLFGVPEKLLGNSNFIPISGHISGIDEFDASFWSMTPNEAKNMDPQIRKFLEHCWYLLEDAGYLNIRHKINIGVFAGGGNSAYSYKYNNTSSSQRDLSNIRGITNLDIKDALSTKVSYLLGLTGPAININTACSTSLVSIIEACKNLTAGSCDMAIAGGVSLLLPEEVGYTYQEGMILSRDGHCRPFDAKASGTIVGSGVGAVLLKRLSDAEADKDNIIAVIKGYATNNDGDRKISYTAPSIIGQKECIISAQKMAGVTSDLIDYVECHGTGTKLGDPIEIQALDEAFKYSYSNKGKSQKCYLGSVKANIGHADSAAGVAGLIKVCKMIKNNIIPKQINYLIPNPELHLADTNFEIPAESIKWQKLEEKLPRLAGISSFGIGGTNAHVILGEYIPSVMVKEKEGKVPELMMNEQSASNYILPLSANNKISLKAYKNDFVDYLKNTTDQLDNIAYTSQLRREHFNCRLSVVCNSIEDAIEKLKATNLDIKTIKKVSGKNIIFIFPGQGVQYLNMSIDLYRNDQDYKNILDDCLQIANKYTEIPVEKILFPDLFGKKESSHDINQTEWAQLTLFIVSYSLAKLLEKLNIKANIFLGQSIGEWVAATLAGVFSLEDAIKLVVVRGKLMQSMPKGSMLSIQADISGVENFLKNSDCEISVVSTPNNFIVSGSISKIKQLKEKLDEAGIASIILKVSHGYHSSSMEKAAKKFLDEFKGIKLNNPNVRFISNITGGFISAEDAISPKYWSRQIRKPVLLSDGIKTLLNHFDEPCFIEVGPGKAITSLIKQYGANINTIQIFNSASDKKNELPDICSREDILSKFWMHGYELNFKDYNSYQNKNYKVVHLPKYNFEKNSYWLERQPIISENKKIIKNNKLALGSTLESQYIDPCNQVKQIFSEILGMVEIDENDDFFQLGGDSIMAVQLVAKLQHNFKINLADIFTLRTPEKISKFATFSENNLKQKLEKIKEIYKDRNTNPSINEKINADSYEEYLNEAKCLNIKPKNKQIKNVLLTGATGHVGCNILYQLLTETPYKIYLLVKADTDEHAYKRINDKFKFYFDLDLDAYIDRLSLVPCDLEKEDLNLKQDQYQGLVSKIDSIIHSAARVKHYGNYEDLYQANVQATLNLLELCRLTAKKDFHYISTLAVLFEAHVPNGIAGVFTENDNQLIINQKNIYAETKYEGELAVHSYRRYGVNGNIYRLGNVAMHSKNYKHQENIEDNAFFNFVKSMVNFGVIAKEISSVEISPVDSVASAIVKIFNQADLSNQTYHVFNPYLCNVGQLFAKDKGLNIKEVSMDKFIDNILDKIDNGVNNKQLELFMLHQGWLREDENLGRKINEVLQDKTNATLAKLNFSWPIITRPMLNDIIQRSFNSN